MRVMWHEAANPPSDDVALWWCGKVLAKKICTKTRLVLLGAKLENNATVVVMADDVAMQKQRKGGHAKVAIQRW